ncbi:MULTISPECIES: putative lipid II flippase FtsW [Pontibacillus]|uniref:Probable peptidoglycan glycosyltransferase FtsW n=1 Tax=Pontibacillus chungwhensis TaxID=265426 RepID=A0ABY8V1K0_9BACI|nr:MULTISPECIES: putative lipid II flippase FtsW [Pontibacillus]MCD5322546.1 putative lipid II flippase FtsW [Pontibacillus sp. HN14]WIF99831.1 putative lipid II flippase FtsW [Pontibacillus chungwhensis]
MKKLWKNFDFTLIFTPLILTAFGVVMIYSASMVYAVAKWGYSPDHYLNKQLVWCAIGMVAFAFTVFFPYQKYQKWMPIILFGVAILLALVWSPLGDYVNGAYSWLVLGPIRIQPAELAKVGLIMYLASALAKKQDRLSSFKRGVIPPMFITFLILGLIIWQPDVGTASIIGLIAATVFLSAGIHPKIIGMLTVLGGALISIFILTSVVTDSERVARFTGAYEPFSDPADDGYHLIQSYIAIGTGGLSGDGLGQGVQKLGYLLEPHTDFIMAVIAEELGLLGVLLGLGLLTIIVLRGLFIARKCTDAFGSLLAIGISSMVGIQTIINLGAVSGLLPITGVPLPFVSYGGSSLVVLLASMGILNNIARQVRMQDQPKVYNKTVTEEDHSANQVPTLQQRKARGGRQWANERKSIRY